MEVEVLFAGETMSPHPIFLTLPSPRYACLLPSTSTLPRVDSVRSYRLFHTMSLVFSPCYRANTNNPVENDFDKTCRTCYNFMKTKSQKVHIPYDYPYHTTSHLNCDNEVTHRRRCCHAGPPYPVIRIDYKSSSPGFPRQSRKIEKNLRCCRMLIR